MLTLALRGRGSTFLVSLAPVRSNGRNMMMTSPSQTDETFTIGIFIHEGVEELDFCGPFEALKSAAQFRKVNDMYPNWQVFTVAEAPGILKASGELLIQPHYTFENHPKIDLLLLPGGSTNLQLERPAVIEWVR